MAEPVRGRTQSGSKAVAVILGSAFDAGLSGLTLKCQEAGAPWGRQPVYHAADVERPAYVIFRHELPHRLLPNQIPYRLASYAAAVAPLSETLLAAGIIADSEVHCGAEILMRTVGPFQRGYLYDGLPSAAPDFQDALSRAQQHILGGHHTCSSQRRSPW